MSNEMATYYKALSNPVRLAVFMYVVDHSANEAQEYNDETCVCEISKAVNIPQPTASNHLRVLEEAGLVQSTKVGIKCYQYVRRDAAEALFANAQHIFEMARKNPK